MIRFSIKYGYYFKTFPKYLYLVLFSSLSIVCFQELYCYKQPSIFYGAYEIGQIIEKILLSFISGVIFYFLTNHYPKQSKKKKIDTILHNTKFNQRLMATSLLYSIYNKMGISLPDNINTISEMEIRKLLTPQITYSSIKYTYDDIIYCDFLHLLEGVQIEFMEYYDLITPYIEYLDKDTLEGMADIINYFVIIHNPNRAIRANQRYSVNILASIIYKMIISTNKFKI